MTRAAESQRGLQHHPSRRQRLWPCHTLAHQLGHLWYSWLLEGCSTPGCGGLQREEALQNTMHIQLTLTQMQSAQALRAATSPGWKKSVGCPKSQCVGSKRCKELLVPCSAVSTHKQRMLEQRKPWQYWSNSHGKQDTDLLWLQLGRLGPNGACMEQHAVGLDPVENPVGCMTQDLLFLKLHHTKVC